MQEFINHHDPQMKELKQKTIKGENIVFVGEYFRYVNHPEKLLTTGFKQVKSLQEYSNDIRFDTKTLEIMKDRYNTHYNKG